MVAHQNVVHRLVGTPAVPRDAWPNDDFFTPDKDFFFNGEAVIVSHLPAVTDGDSIVFFRRSDVVSTGDLFTPGRYPAIDLAAGGSIQGEIDALNTILHLTVPAKYQEGGTYVIPDFLCNAGGVTVSYFEMVQNMYNYYWDLETVHKRLEEKMVKAFNSVLDTAKKLQVNNRVAAYAVAVSRVAEAMKLRGWV